MGAGQTYSALSGIVGTKTPNYQGMFLRGYGSQAYAQNNGSTVGVTSTTYSSGALGQVQGDAMRIIFGGWHTPNGIQGASGEVAVSGQLGNDNTATGFNEWGSQKSVTIDSSKIIPTDSEIRPVNMSVRYLIRSLP